MSLLLNHSTRSSPIICSFGTRCCNQRQIYLKFVMKKKIPPRLPFRGVIMKWGFWGQNGLNQQTWSHRRSKLCLKHPDGVITQEEKGLSDHLSCSPQSSAELQQAEALRWERNGRTEDEQNYDLKGVFVL